MFTKDSLILEGKTNEIVYLNCVMDAVITIVLKLSADMSFVRALWNLSIVR